MELPYFIRINTYFRIYTRINTYYNIIKRDEMMKISELIKILKKNGCTMVNNGGRHDIWYSPITQEKIAIPRHGSKEIATGTANGILKKQGLSNSCFISPFFPLRRDYI